MLHQGHQNHFILRNATLGNDLLPFHYGAKAIDHCLTLLILNSGTLKVIPQHGESHLLRLKKNNAYWLPKDKPGSLHADQNIGKHPIKVIVIEIKFTHQ